MITFVFVVHSLIAILLVTLILLQQSEGGALGMGGSPTGMLSARGAANFFTRFTAWTAFIFVCTSILLSVLAATGTAPRLLQGSVDLPPGAPSLLGAPLHSSEVKTTSSGLPTGAQDAKMAAPTGSSGKADQGAQPQKPEKKDQSATGHDGVPFAR